MAADKKEKEFNPVQYYLLMGAGACLIMVRFMDDLDEWSTIDILKVGVGVATIVYGIFKLVRKK